MAHCKHADELPRWMVRRLMRECKEIDPRKWDNVDALFADLERECEEEEQVGANAKRLEKPGFFRKVAAVFA